MCRFKRLALWSLALVYLSLCALVVISFTTGAGVVVSGAIDEEKLSRRAWNVGLHRASVSIMYYPDQNFFHGPEGVDGVTVEFWSGGPYRSTSGVAWLWPSVWHGGSSAGAYTLWEVPLGSPAVLLTLVVVVGAVRHRKPKPGYCPGCGYVLAGLPGATCPECGRTL